MSDFDLNLLRPLDALLRARSVTAAAKLIGVGQPTMSGMLARLRDQLCDPLLVRVGRTMELTPRAAALAADVRQILLRAEQVGAPPGVADIAATQRHFRIMASEFGLYLVLPAVFARAAKELPLATFEVLPIDRPADSVFSGDVNFCLTGDRLSAVGGEMANVVRTRAVGVDRFVGMVASAHPLTGLVTVDQLLAFPHVATQFPHSPWTVEDIGLSGLSDRCPPRIRVGSFLAVARLVAGTNGFGIIPSRLAAIASASLDVRTLILPEEFEPITIKMIYHDRFEQDAAHLWLRNATGAIRWQIE